MNTVLTSRLPLKKAREKSFMEGREYKHVAHDGMPWDNSPCFYNLEEIDR
ncbi:excisionase [Escherichia coli]|nr:excisionase [Escherichia coli]OKT52646.1 excisionase [Escherichia coli]OKT54729.1 excisionase [Escherichia coli]